MSDYQFTREALGDLDELWVYIAIENPDAADRVVADILDTCERLGAMPGLGHTREDLTDRPVRFFPVGRYLVIYRPDRTPIDIIAVLHSARDVPRILTDR
jgi:plasmid stabilization system protein ParE